MLLQRQDMVGFWQRVLEMEIMGIPPPVRHITSETFTGMRKFLELSDEERRNLFNELLPFMNKMQQIIERHIPHEIVQDILVPPLPLEHFQPLLTLS